MNPYYKINKADFFFHPEELKNRFQLSETEEKLMCQVTKTYKMQISKFYADLIEPENPEDPIKKQCVPDPRELEQTSFLKEDPLEESRCSPVPFLVHKYKDRVAFFASNLCFTYCRHCTRKNTVITNPIASGRQFEDILDYLKRTPQIRDVLITGGDPLTLSDELLEHYISSIRTISHIQTIRIGTRAIVTYPKRITENLADMLAKYHPLWINTQFNHPAELTPEAEKACGILLNRGIPLGNQSVLMKGINDDIDTMEQLVLGLIRARVRPYYLYQLDNVKGTRLFYVPYTTGMDLIDELRRRVSGYAVPHFIIDAPGENGGKIVVEHNHIKKALPDRLILQGRAEGTLAEYQFQSNEGENHENRTHL